MLDLLAPLSVVSQPAFIQMRGEVTHSGPQSDSTEVKTHFSQGK